MAQHMACKGLVDLRAVASLAGTSYVEDASCDGAQPVSVLHVHGTDDYVIRFDGDRIQPNPTSGGESAFYAGGRDIVKRWSRIAGCDWSENAESYASLDLDQSVPGAETEAYRLASGCGEGIDIQLWIGDGSSHSPGYDTAFIRALLDWLLAQQ